MVNLPRLREDVQLQIKVSPAHRPSREYGKTILVVPAWSSTTGYVWPHVQIEYLEGMTIASAVYADGALARRPNALHAHIRSQWPHNVFPAIVARTALYCL